MATRKFSQIATVTVPFDADDYIVAVQDGTTDVRFTNAQMFGAMTGANPVSNDGASMGSGVLSWSDLFLAAGGVINWNNGAATLAESGGFLVYTTDVDQGAFQVVNTNDGVNGAALTLYADSATPNTSDVTGSVIFRGNTTTTPTNYALITSTISDTTGTSADALLNFYAIGNNTLQRMSLSGPSLALHPNGSSLSLGAAAAPWTGLYVGSSGFVDFNSDVLIQLSAANTLSFSGASSGYIFDAALEPSANDGAALGVSGTAFSDLFLASGGVINWNAGQLILTQASAQLTLAGAAASGTIYIIQNTDNGTTGGNLTFFHDSQSPAASDNIGRIDFQGRDSAGPPGNVFTYASFRAQIASPTDGSESGLLLWSVGDGAGVNTVNLALSNTALRPNTNDQITLGTATVSWADLFLASGAVINFANGALTITHASGKLTWAGSAFEWLDLGAAWGSSEPVTKTGTSGSQGTADSSLIMNASGTYTLTLLSAATYPGRWLCIKNIAAQTVNSASSNVVPLAGGAAGTAILTNVAGRWALLQSDGSNWIIMAGVT